MTTTIVIVNYTDKGTIVRTYNNCSTIKQAKAKGLKTQGIWRKFSSLADAKKFRERFDESELNSIIHL